MEDNPIHCENCNSTNIEAKEQGFDNDTAVVGGLLFGGLGMLVAGYKNRKMIIIHCLDCKHQSNHNRAMGTNYKSFKTQFYERYTNEKFEEAFLMYSSYLDEPGDAIENVHEVYERFRKEDQRSKIITISFIIFIILLLAIIFLAY